MCLDKAGKVCSYLFKHRYDLVVMLLDCEVAVTISGAHALAHLIYDMGIKTVERMMNRYFEEVV